jgi:prepilin-type N-terminal cleavage/methylation domain-containing protein
MMNRGFTLIEMMVSVALFTAVMVVALGALLGLSEANRKADSLSAAVNNLGAALDDMSRTIRTGSNYNCGAVSPVTSPHDCSGSASPGTAFSFLASDGVTETVYRLNTTANNASGSVAGGNTCGQITGTIGCIERSQDGGVTWLPITSADVVVQNLNFYVIGSSPSDHIQPKVTIVIDGYVIVTTSVNPSVPGQQSAFDIQTSVTQRVYDQ